MNIRLYKSITVSLVELVTLCDAPCSHLPHFLIQKWGKKGRKKNALDGYESCKQVCV